MRFVDLWTTFAGRPDRYRNDGLHMTDRGAEVLGAGLARAIGSGRALEGGWGGGGEGGGRGEGGRYTQIRQGQSQQRYNCNIGLIL